MGLRYVAAARCCLWMPCSTREMQTLRNQHQERGLMFEADY